MAITSEYNDHKQPLISFVIPFFNAHETIEKTLDSLYLESDRDKYWIEVIVIDDGSLKPINSSYLLEKYQEIKILRLEKNQGKIAAVNAGIEISSGHFVIQLDSDDWLIPNWPLVFEKIRLEWPNDVDVCLSACKTQHGITTVSFPEYNGYLTLNDRLMERYSGEYLVLFKGEYIRKKGGYINLGTKKVPCEGLTYLHLAREKQFWVSSHILRFYNVGQDHSLSSNWGDKKRAEEMTICIEKILNDFSEELNLLPIKFKKRFYLKKLVYQSISGNHLVTWRELISSIHYKALKESLGLILFLILGSNSGLAIVGWGKKLRLIKNFG